MKSSCGRFCVPYTLRETRGRFPDGYFRRELSVSLHDAAPPCPAVVGNVGPVPTGDGGPTMTTKTLPEVPVGMQRIYRRFERWRKSHRGRLPIPEALWAAVAELAREHGVFRTAKTLRLEHSKLKGMVKVKSTKPAVRRAPLRRRRTSWSWWHRCPLCPV